MLRGSLQAKSDLLFGLEWSCDLVEGSFVAALRQGARVGIRCQVADSEQLFVMVHGVLRSSEDVEVPVIYEAAGEVIYPAKLRSLELDDAPLQ